MSYDTSCTSIPVPLVFYTLRCAHVPGPCARAFHLDCLQLPGMPPDDEWLCPDCDSHTHTCLYCGKSGDDLEPGMKADDSSVRKCCMKRCGRFYHTKWVPAHVPARARLLNASVLFYPVADHSPTVLCVYCCCLVVCRCLEAMALVNWSSDKKSFRCPQHYCASCDNATGTGNNVIVLCNRCPVAFHLTCLPDTITRLNRKVMVCPAHQPGGHTVKVRVAACPLNPNARRVALSHLAACVILDPWSLIPDPPLLGYVQEILGWDGRSAGPRLRQRKARVTFSDEEEPESSSSSSSSESDDGDAGDGSEASTDSTLYCVCRKPAKEGEMMVACDACDGWFHPGCVGLDPKTAETLPTYTCDSCRCGGPWRR